MSDQAENTAEVGSSARTSADDRNPGNWEARPNLSRLIRIFVAAVPIAASVVALRVVTSMVSRPESLIGTILWFVGAIAVAFVVMRIVERMARRLLPLATLFKFSLIFPDRAPKRFSVALRSGTTRQLESKMKTLRENPESVDLADGAEALIGLVGMISEHDRLTRGHCERVRAYSDMIGEEMGLSDDDREKLNWAALLHDVGKLKVEAAILTKPGKPNDEEWEQIQTHPAVAAELLKPLVPWLGDWTRSASDHHERWDGTGYPVGLSGEDISLAGRIVAVADAFDVMTAARSYKEPISPEKARDELAACAGTQFDPTVVRAFLNVGIGRQRGVAGSIAWAVQFPGLAQSMSAVSSTAGTAVAATALTAMSVVGGAGVGQSPSAASEQAAAVEIQNFVATDLIAPVEVEAPTVVVLGTTDSADPVEDPAPTTTVDSVDTKPDASAPVAVVEAPTSVPPATTTTTTAAAPTTTAASTTTTAPPTTTTAAPTTTTVAPTTTTAPPTTTTAAPTTTTAAPTTTTAAPTTTTTAAPTEFRTATTAGGTVVFSFDPGYVDVVSTSPAPGFVVEIKRRTDKDLDVKFVSVDSEPTVRARWRGKSPLVEVR